MPMGKGRRTIKDDGPDPIDVFVATRVRARRQGLRISQTKLAQPLGITYQQVQKYENGTNRIGASNLLKISKVLKVDVRHFFEGLERDVKQGSPPQDTASVEEQILSRDSIRFVHDYFRIMNERPRKKISQLVEELANAGE